MGAKKAQRKKAKAGKKGWKDLQLETKTRKKVQLGVAVLIFLLVFFLISRMVHFTQSILSPWRMPAQAPNSIGPASSKTYQWEEKFNINLLIRAKDITLLSYNPKETKLFIVNIPDQAFVNAAHGFGSWQLGSVYQLGESQSGLGGNKLLADTLTAFLALPIDGFLDFTNNAKEGREIIKTLRQSPLAVVMMLKEFKSNFTVYQLVKLNLKIAGVRFDKEQVIDLAKLNILDKENLADQTPVLVADPVRLDSVLQDLTDPQVVLERKSIAVLNATDHPGLAQKAARLVTNLGGNVIVTANAKNTLKQTQVIGANAPTLDRLKQIFEVSGKISPQASDLIYERAQITILLGEDYFNNQ